MGIQWKRNKHELVFVNLIIDTGVVCVCVSFIDSKETEHSAT